MLQDFRAINKSAAKKGVRHLGGSSNVFFLIILPTPLSVFLCVLRAKQRTVKQMTAFRKAVDIRQGFVGSSVRVVLVSAYVWAQLGCTHGPLKLVPDVCETLWTQAWLSGSFQPGLLPLASISEATYGRANLPSTPMQDVPGSKQWCCERSPRLQDQKRSTTCTSYCRSCSG